MRVIQWGSEFWTSSVFEWSKRGRMPIDRSGIQMPFQFWTSRPFEYGTNGRHLVFLFTGTVFEWHKMTIWISNNWKSEHQKVWYSNGLNSDPQCKLILLHNIAQCFKLICLCQHESENYLFLKKFNSSFNSFIFWMLYATPETFLYHPPKSPPSS